MATNIIYLQFIEEIPPMGSAKTAVMPSPETELLQKILTGESMSQCELVGGSMNQADTIQTNKQAEIVMICNLENNNYKVDNKCTCKIMYTCTVVQCKHHCT
jgi:hypothetical protein